MYRINWSKCVYCGREAPELAPDAATLTAIARSLECNSVSTAITEIDASTACGQEAARACIDHWLLCSRSWPLDAKSTALLRTVERAFSDIPKPEHFTDHTHCDECAEHDETLRSNSPGTITRDDLGSMGWDPITFSSVAGKAHYLPALARYALLPNLWAHRDWYLPQLLWHIGHAGADNPLLKFCSADQRAAVRSLLVEIEATRDELLDQYGEREELAKAIELWRDERVV